MKLQLGCGRKERPGEDWLNVDIIAGSNVDIISSAHELTNIGDNSVDEILAEHLLEHLTFYQANRALAEWYRVLRPGARLTLEVPDIYMLCWMFCQATEYQRFQSNHGSWSISHHLWGNQRGFSDEEQLSQTHKSGYTFKRLKEMLLGVRFNNIKREVPVKDTPGSYVIRISCQK
jgi:predicted SAM-dependent methyltransferase